MERYCFFWSLVNFLSETNLIWRATRQASLCRRWMSMYRGIWAFPEARLLRPLCHPSTSLLVRICCLYTLQQERGQVVLCIQVLSTYSTNFCRGSVVACSWRRVNIAGISLGGRNGKAIILRRYLKVPSSDWYAGWSPRSWICNVKKRMLKNGKQMLKKIGHSSQLQLYPSTTTTNLI